MNNQAEFDPQRVFLLPGEYHVTRRKCEIATLLGKLCRSVTLKHKHKPSGAMNHFLLSASAEPQQDKGRYGDLATKTIIWLMQKIDSDLSNLQAGIYGGAAVVSHLSNGKSGDIGKKNIEIARSILRTHRIKIIEEEIGGNHGRRIYFNTETGKVTTKIISKTAEAQKTGSKTQRSRQP